MLKCDKIKAWTKKHDITKKKVFAFFFAIVITSIGFIDSNFFHAQITKTLFISEIVIFSILLAVLMVYAGMFVVRALVRVSVGLSLILFLSQSYCNVSHRTQNGDQALQWLVVLSLFYIVYDFLTYLWRKIDNKVLKKIERKNKISSKKDRKIGNFFKITFLFFVVFSVWMVYQVVQPIFSDLCIYKQ